ncbi:hypothetical protein HDV06_001825, partial [Boothiomyces sp. JEL0866]
YSIETTVASSDGIIGLASPGESAAAPYGADIFAVLAHQTNTTQAVASFWYDRSQNLNFNDSTKGEILFGGADTTRYTPPLQYIPVPSDKTNWFTNLDSISIKNDPQKYILGAFFLRNFYTVFDYGNSTGNAQIGIAKPSDNVVITIPTGAPGSNSNSATVGSMLAYYASLFAFVLV